MAMEVIIHSSLSHAPGKLTVVAEPDQPLDSLITAFCIEKNIRHEKKYVLRNRRQEILNNTLKINTCNIQNGDTLFLGIRAPGEEWICGCSQWWILAGVTLFIGCVGLVAISITKVNTDRQPDSYGVVFDAGSSHTQMYVYKWPGDKENNTAIAKQTHTCKTGTAISSFANNPSGAGDSLNACLEEGVNKVPELSYINTNVYLGATAGMRLLRAQNNVTAARIMDSVRQSLQKSKFKFKSDAQAVILEGSDEGAFSWVTANYLDGKFIDKSITEHLYRSIRSLMSTPSKRATYGALDLGGASTQMTFVPMHGTKLPAAYQKKLVMYGEEYPVYTHSYLCYGMNEAYRQLLAELVKNQNYSTTVENSCAPKGNTFNQTFAEIFEVPCTIGKGYVPPKHVTNNTMFIFHGTSDGETCLNDTSALFHDAKCAQKNCTFNGVYQPTIDGKFLAFSSYYYTAAFFNQTKQAPNHLKAFTETVENFCVKNWTEVLKIPITDSRQRENLNRYCFEGHYILGLLAKYGFTTDETWKLLQFQDKVKQNDLGWSLGFMLNASNTIPAQYPNPAFSLGVFILLIILFAIFIVLAILFGCYAKRSSKQNSDYQRLQSYGSV